MPSLRAALEGIGVDAHHGIRESLPVRPAGLRELIRVARVPRPRLADLEPDEPAAFSSFETEDPQGLVHAGGDRWILSSQQAIRRCRISGDDPFRPPPADVRTRRGLSQLLAETPLAAGDYDHIGDLGFADGVVYAPVRNKNDSRPHLVMGLSTDLDVIGWAELATSTGESACAVNPWNGFLYVPERRAQGLLHAHDIAAFRSRRAQPSRWGQRIDIQRRAGADIQMRTPEGREDFEGLQGLAFSAHGHMYVTRSGPSEPYDNRLFLYSALTGRRFEAGRRYDFPGHGGGREIQGVAFHPAGVLYLAVNDNDNEFFDQDNFDLYTFRVPTGLRVRSELDLGAIPLGRSITRTITVGNFAGASVTVIAAAPAGSRFRWAAVTETLNHGDSLDIPITFTPVAAHPTSAAIRIDSTAAGIGPVVVRLTGRTSVEDA